MPVDFDEGNDSDRSRQGTLLLFPWLFAVQYSTVVQYSSVYSVFPLEHGKKTYFLLVWLGYHHFADAS